MSLDNSSQPSVTKYIHGRPEPELAAKASSTKSAGNATPSTYSAFRKPRYGGSHVKNTHHGAIRTEGSIH
jgi:hypothetical protein